MGSVERDHRSTRRKSEGPEGVREHGAGDVLADLTTSSEPSRTPPRSGRDGPGRRGAQRARRRSRRRRRRPSGAGSRRSSDGRTRTGSRPGHAADAERDRRGAEHLADPETCSAHAPPRRSREGREHSSVPAGRAYAWSAGLDRSKISNDVGPRWRSEVRQAVVVERGNSRRWRVRDRSAHVVIGMRVLHASARTGSGRSVTSSPLN